MSNKEIFIETYNKNIHRPGAEKLLAWLEGTDFFTAPASTRFHAAYEGGLLDHSLNVYNVLISKHFNPETDDLESYTIVSLLHDLCKAGFYKTELRNRKNDRGEWEKVPVYAVDDQFPYGHGEKSVFLIERFMRLRTEEAIAVRWHMGGFDESVKGGYNVVKIDPNYEPKQIEQRDIFGIRFEQGYNNYEINESLLTNIVTENKNLPESAKHDMILALITLKYTQSNSVCYVKDGMTIGVGAGQQSRIHCTRLAGNKADNWFVRQHPKVLGLQFVDGIRRPDRDNAIDVYTSDEYEDVLAEGVWQKTFKVKPEVLTAEEKKAWIAKNTGVTVGSDAFFPFGDNVERARKSGVEYIVQPGGSIRDDNVIETANKYGITMAFTGMRLFHH